MNSRLTFFVGTQASGKIEVLREINSMRSTRAPLNGLVTMTGLISSPENSLAPYNVNAMFSKLHHKLIARSCIVTLTGRTIKRPAKIVFVFSILGNIDEQISYLEQQKHEIEKVYTSLKLDPPVCFLVITNHVVAAERTRGRAFSITHKVDLDDSQRHVISQLTMNLRVRKDRIISYADFENMKKFVTGIKDVLKKPAFLSLQTTIPKDIKRYQVHSEERADSSQVYLMEDASRSSSPQSPGLQINTELDVDDTALLLDTKPIGKEIKQLPEVKMDRCPEEPFLNAIDIIIFQPAKDEKEEAMKAHVLDCLELLQKKIRSIKKWDNEKYEALSEELCTVLSGLSQPIVNDPSHWDQRLENLIEFRKNITAITKTCSNTSKFCASAAGFAIGGLAGVALAGPGAPVIALGGKVAVCALFGATAAGGVSSIDDDGTKKLIFAVADAALAFAKCNDSIDLQSIPEKTSRGLKKIN